MGQERAQAQPREAGQHREVAGWVVGAGHAPALEQPPEGVDVALAVGQEVGAVVVVVRVAEHGPRVAPAEQVQEAHGQAGGHDPRQPPGEAPGRDGEPRDGRGAGPLAPARRRRRRRARRRGPLTVVVGGVSVDVIGGWRPPPPRRSSSRPSARAVGHRPTLVAGPHGRGSAGGRPLGWPAVPDALRDWGRRVLPPVAPLSRAPGGGWSPSSGSARSCGWCGPRRPRSRWRCGTRPCTWCWPTTWPPATATPTARAPTRGDRLLPAGLPAGAGGRDLAGAAGARRLVGVRRGRRPQRRAVGGHHRAGVRAGPPAGRPGGGPGGRRHLGPVAQPGVPQRHRADRDPVPVPVRAAAAGGAGVPGDRSRPGTRRLVAIGVLFGLCLLVRPVSLVAAPAFLVLWWGPAVRTVLWRGAVAGLATVAVLLPWAVRSTLVMDAPVALSLNLGDNLCLGHNPGASGGFGDLAEHCYTAEGLRRPESETRRQSENIDRALRYVRDEPATTLRRTVTKAPDHPGGRRRRARRGRGLRRPAHRVRRHPIGPGVGGQRLLRRGGAWPGSPARWCWSAARTRPGGACSSWWWGLAQLAAPLATFGDPGSRCRSTRPWRCARRSPPWPPPTACGWAGRSAGESAPGEDRGVPAGAAT